MDRFAPVAITFFVVAATGFVLIRERVRRLRRERDALDVPALVGARLTADPGSALDLPRPLDDGGFDLWEEIRERVDISRMRPRLAEDVEIRVFELRWGKDYALAANPRDLLHLNLEVWEAELAQRMDGTRTVADLILDHLESSGDLDAEAVTDLVLIFESAGFLDPVPVNVDEQVRGAIDAERGGLRRLRRFASTFTLEWSGADRMVNAVYRACLKPFFHPVVAVCMAVVAFAGFGFFIAVEHSGKYSLGGEAAPLDSLLLIFFGWLLTFSHELGHAAVLVHNRRKIKNAGFMLYFGSPAFFVDASDGLMMDAPRRIMQSFAGPFAELVLAGLCAIALYFMPEGGAAELLYRFALLNYFVIFLNLIPLLELDGYWILSDVIQMPDLRPRSLEFIQHDLWHKIRTRERVSPQELGLALYGLVGVAFTVLCVITAAFFWRQTFGNLFVSLWRGGLGSKILLVLLVLALGGPVVRGLVNLVKAIGRRFRAIGRKIRFKLETRWRVEAAELIDALPAFDDLPTDVLNDLAGRVVIRTMRAGQPVVRQGDRSVSFFVIRSGTLDVETEHPETGEVTLLRTLGRGDSFGEIGLLDSAPRQATVRASTDSDVFEIDKGTFDRLLADPINAPKFGPTLRALAELRELPAFAQLGTDRLAEIVEHGGWVSFAPGVDLMEQGAAGDAFYAIASGQAEVMVDGERVDTMGPGGHAGELALLHNAPRTATVRAMTPLRAFRLDKEGFDAVVADAFRRGSLRSTARRA